MPTYGHRARIGYTAPPFVTEIFPCEFYKIAPRGVTLGITTLTTWEMTSAELEKSVEISRRAAKAMARAGMDVVVLGGVPLNLALGFVRELEEECGIPATSSSMAEAHGLSAIGARRVGQVHPTRDFSESYWADHVRHLGYEPLGVKRAEYSVRDLGRIPPDVPAQLVRDLIQENPQVDTVVIGNSHWATVVNVEALEQELGVNVLSQSLLCIWEGLRRSGIMEAIPGFGRLLREH